MYILGISLGHDVSAAVVTDCRVVAAVQEERLTRVKLHSGLPVAAVAEAIDLAGISPEQIAACAVGWNVNFLYEVAESVVADMNIRFADGEFFSDVLIAAVSRLERLIQDGIPQSIYQQVNNAVESVIRIFLEDIAGSEVDVHYVPHHTAHAGSVYYSCPWQKALVITSDGKGGGLASTVSLADNGKMTELFKTPDSDSIANFYAAITRYLGYKANRHEGKITGLAAYGDSTSNMRACSDLFRYDRQSHSVRSKLSDIWREWTNDNSWQDKVYVIFNPETDGGTLGAILRSEGHIRQFRANFLMFKSILDEKLVDKSPAAVAAFAQDLLEEVVVQQIANTVEETGIGYLCLAGGLFANVKLNQAIRQLPGVENVYIYPGMGDSGTAAGAALEVYFYIAGYSQHVSIDNVYLGREFSREQVRDAVEAAGYSFNWHDDAEALIAGFVHDGKVVGLFNSRAEWGPRALGARTILVRPTDKNINDQLNHRLKRTEFMPFAPVILSEKAPEYFLGYRQDHIAARFMTMVYDVFPEKVKSCSAVVHVDNTARPQVIARCDNEYYYDILNEYYKISGIPILVNTSFNMHEEPMVYTPQDAIRSFQADAVDILVLGRCIITR